MGEFKGVYLENVMNKQSLKVYHMPSKNCILYVLSADRDE